MTILQVLSMSLLGWFGWGINVQNINPDSGNWPLQVLRFNYADIDYRIPPDGHPIIKAPYALDVRGSTEWFWIYSQVGYDRYDYLSEFSIRLTVVKNKEPVMLKNWEQAKTSLTKHMREISVPGFSVSEYTTIKGNKSLRFLPESKEDEIYVIPINRDYSLYVAGYFQQQILKKEKWFQSRREILRKVVDTVEIHHMASLP